MPEPKPENDARWCDPHGEQHDDLICLRQLAEAASAGGRWTADLDSCDCGDGYGCSHGSWVHAVHVEKAHNQGSRREICDPTNSLDCYAHDRSELSDFSWDEAHYVVAAQPSAVLALLDRIAAATAACEAVIAADDMTQWGTHEGRWAAQRILEALISSPGTTTGGA